MNVIRHHDPRLHLIVAAIRLEQNLFDEFSQVTLQQPTFAMSAIQPCFKLSPLRGIVRLFQNRFKLRTSCYRKRVMKLESDELHDTRRVEVRQVPTLMPAAKTFFNSSMEGLQSRSRLARMSSSSPTFFGNVRRTCLGNSIA